MNGNDQLCQIKSCEYCKALILREKCLHLELFSSKFFRIPTRITPNTATFYAV